VKFDQARPFHGDTVDLSVTLRNTVDSSQVVLRASLKIQHRTNWTAEEYDALKATYFLAGTPTLFLALPPLKPNIGSPKPPILALREAFRPSRFPSSFDPSDP
jgi:hypothetical protein